VSLVGDRACFAVCNFRSMRLILVAETQEIADSWVRFLGEPYRVYRFIVHTNLNGVQAMRVAVDAYPEPGFRGNV